MAIGITSDMINYNEQYYGGFMNRVQTKLDVFNASSGGTINLSTMLHKGSHSEESFFTDNITVQHRDPNDVTEMTPDSIGSDDTSKVKIYKSIFVEQAIQSFRGQQLDLGLLAFMVGQKSGDLILKKWRESAVSCAAGAFDIAGFASGVDQLVLDKSQEAGDGVLSVNTMIEAMPLFGDATDRIRMVVMHSDVYWPLVGKSATDLATPATADFAVRGGLPATLGLPILVVNSDALVIPNGNLAGTGNAYRTLCLVEGALSVEESEMPFTATDVDIKRANTTQQFKSEIAYSIALKGMKFSLAVENPEDAALATAANWTKKYASKYDLMGIEIRSVGVANA